jgi:hypothetical protein
VLLELIRTIVLHAAICDGLGRTEIGFATAPGLRTESDVVEVCQVQTRIALKFGSRSMFNPLLLVEPDFE